MSLIAVMDNLLEVGLWVRRGTSVLGIMNLFFRPNRKTSSCFIDDRDITTWTTYTHQTRSVKARTELRRVLHRRKVASRLTQHRRNSENSRNKIIGITNPRITTIDTVSVTSMVATHETNTGAALRSRKGDTRYDRLQNEPQHPPVEVA